MQKIFLCLLFCVFTGNLVATPVSASISADNYTLLNLVDSTQYVSAAWSVGNPAPGPLSTSTTGTLPLFSATSSTSASFSADGNFATFNFTEHLATNFANGNVEYPYYSFSGSSFTYTFVADATGVMTLQYDLEVTNPNGSLIQFPGFALSPAATFVGTITNNGTASETGTLTGNVVAGVEYTVGVNQTLQGTFIIDAPTTPNNTGNLTATFNFTAPTAVPEPGAAAAILGTLALVAVGWVRRRA